MKVKIRPGDRGTRIDPAKISIASKDRPEPKPEKSQTYVYFVSDGISIKIGISVDPNKRIASLQSCHPTARLQLLGVKKGDRQLESSLHKQFQPYRLSGEWFEDAPAIREYIERFTDQTGHETGIELSNSKNRIVQEKLTN